MGRLAEAQTSAASGTSTLMQAIQRLSDVQRDTLDESRSSAQLGRPVLRRILQEVDETILPRSLELRDQAGGTLSLLVSNRRLVELSGVNPDDAPSDPDEMATLAAERIERFVGDDREISIRRDRRVRHGAAGHVSCSAAALAAELGMSLDPPPQGERIETLIRKLSRHAEAMLHLGKGDGSNMATGSESATDMLAALEAGGLARSGPTGTGPQCRQGSINCVAFPLSDGSAILRAQEGEDRLLALLAPNQLESAMQAWQRLFATGY